MKTKNFYIISLITLVVLNILLCVKVFNSNNKQENSTSDIGFRLLHEKYLAEKKAELKYRILPNLSINQKSKIQETFNDSLLNLSLVLRISSNFCGTCVNNSILDFLEQSERSYPKSNSIILAYFSTERDKSLFRAKYDKIANVIFLDNDSFLLELDKFNKPYFFVIDRYCRAYSFLAIPDDFPSIKESYFESLYEEFTAVNYKNIPNIHIVF